MANYDIFKNEEDTLEEAKQVVESMSISTDELKSEFAKLLKSYKGLLSDTKRLMKMSDRQQKELNKRSEELQLTINQLVATQENLIESQKLASLGSLVAGVAHEINTPVGIGVMAASHLEMETKEFLDLFTSGHMKKSDLEKYINSATQLTTLMLANLNRSAELIQHFKQVAVDRSIEQVRAFNIKEYISHILDTLTSELKNKNVSAQIIGEEVAMNSFAGPFSQVISNLVINSLAHAYDGSKEGKIIFEVLQKDVLVAIKYSDDGKGMPKDVLEKIFEPFFTTKRSEGSTGLGMHIVYSIITNLFKGTITCQSTFGEGTTFTITLPINEKQSAPAKPLNF